MKLEARISKKGDLTMNRKIFTGMICLMLLGATFFAPKGQADEEDKKTIVTVNQPIQVPGKVLPAGTYVFKLLNPNDLTLVAIFNADDTHLITTVQGIPDRRMGMVAEDEGTLQLEELAPGQPAAVKAWFYTGDNAGVEFLYPNHNPIK
jgi:hypothetical protein